MSFEFGHYGLGYDYDLPEPPALRFDEMVRLHGKDIRIIWQAVTGYDAYGSPIKTETGYTERGIAKSSPSEAKYPAGHTQRNRVEVLMKRWAPVDQNTCGLKIDGSYYHITGVEYTPAYVSVTAELRVS